MAPLFLKIRPLINILRAHFQAYWFDSYEGSYWAQYGAKETLADNAGLFTLVMPDGTVYQFNDFSAGNAGDGQFSAMYAPSGAATIATPNANGITAQIDYYAAGAYNFSAGTGTPYQSERFQYEDNGQISSITLLDENGLMVRQVTYTYYATGDNYGLAGDLMLATEEFSSDNGATWNGAETYYYRYYPRGGRGGQVRY